ncbi:MAG: NAD(+) kinase [Pseudomonadota bacterium]|mgnify:CR=1 FL=1
MSSQFKVIGLIGKYGDPGIAQTLAAMAGFLTGQALSVLLDEETARTLPGHGLATASRAEIGQGCDLAVVIGGDGTLLNAARSLADFGIPVVGINLGRLGFLADISPADMLECMAEILAGRYCAEDRFLLHAEIHRDGQLLHRGDAFNDVVVHKWNMLRMIEFETHVNGQFMDVQRSDGLIVSTPTGSTAYALSGGGPILMPTLNAIALVPICPHTLSNRPVVVDGDSRIEIVVRDCKQTHAQLTCDGQSNFSLLDGDHIVVRKKERLIRLIHPANHDYFHILRAKLRWGSKGE